MPHLHRFGLVVLATLLPLLFWLPPAFAQAPTAPVGDQSLDPALTQSLQSSLHYERLSGFRQLAGLKAVPASALPLLATGLKDEDEAVRLTAAAALAGVSAAAPEAARVAATALQDASPLVRQFAVRAASCLHDTAGVSAGLLKAASQDSDATVRGLASAGLKQLEGVGSGTEGVRTGGVEGAAQPGGSAQGTNTGPAQGGAASTGGQPRTGTATTPAAAPASTSTEAPDANSLPALIAALSDPNPEVRLRAAQSLGEMGTRAIPAVCGVVDTHVASASVYKIPKRGELVIREIASRGVVAHARTLIQNPWAEGVQVFRSLYGETGAFQGAGDHGAHDGKIVIIGGQSPQQQAIRHGGCPFRRRYIPIVPCYHSARASPLVRFAPEGHNSGKSDC